MVFAYRDSDSLVSDGVYTEQLVERTCFSVLSVFVAQRTLVHPTHTRLAQVLRRIILRAFLKKNTSCIRYVYPACSKLFFLLFDTSTDLDAFSSDADWNQTKPVRDSAIGGTVWPSGRHHSKHTHVPTVANAANLSTENCCAFVPAVESRTTGFYTGVLRGHARE